ncbi:MAG: hypothetical protein ACLUNZ_12330, partial [Evtepia sp.]
LAATDGKLLGDISLDTTISGVETDSRAVHDGDLFVAIRGGISTGTSSSPGPWRAAPWAA